MNTFVDNPLFHQNTFKNLKQKLDEQMIRKSEIFEIINKKFCYDISCQIFDLFEDTTGVDKIFIQYNELVKRQRKYYLRMKYRQLENLDVYKIKHSDLYSLAELSPQEVYLNDACFREVVKNNGMDQIQKDWYMYFLYQKIDQEREVYNLI